MFDRKNKLVELNQSLNKILDSKISVNALLHSFLTDKYLYKPITNLKEINEADKEMGHSVMQALE